MFVLNVAAVAAPVMADKTRERLVAEYVAALGLAVICVGAETEAPPAFLAIGQIVSARRASVLRAAGFHFVRWCPSLDRARDLEAAALKTLTRFKPVIADQGITQFEIPAELLAANVISTAAQLGVELITQEVMTARALVIVETVHTRLEQMRRSGGLVEINTAYREYRLTMIGQDRRPLNYQAYLANHRRHLIQDAARAGKIL